MSHAVLSPSSAARWIACPGSVRLSAGIPDKSSAHAEEGTRAHELAAAMLTGATPAGYDADMVAYVEAYCQAVRATLEFGAALLVEQRVPIGHITGEVGAQGTADAIVINSSTLGVHDLKYGVGVKVFAKELDGTPNPQLAMYALGTLEKYGQIYDFADVSDVVMFIHQPRLDHVDHFTMTVAELRAWGEKVAAAAKCTTRPDAPLVPGEKQCRWCRAKATCPALAAYVAKSVADDFDLKTVEEVKVPREPDELGVAMSKVGLVEDWCRGVRAAVETRLLQGKDVEGFKLVEGRKGVRKWADEAELVALAKRLRIKNSALYERSVISPAVAEKVFKKAEPKKWERLQASITQPHGKPSVAPANDPRPTYTPGGDANDFLTRESEG